MTRENEFRNRRVVSIEQLLVWAYCQQMVHQATRGKSGLAKSTPPAPMAASSTVWSEVTPVDSSRNQGFDAAEDAWRVHDLVMKLGSSEIDCGADLRASRYHVLGQYRGAEPPTGAGSVDVTGKPWPTDGMLHVDLRALVMIHATKATRPNRLLTVDFRMKPGPIVRHPKQRGGVYRLGWYCHVTAIGTLPGEVAQEFSLYRAWRDALVGLRDRLRSTSLTMFNVTSDLPPAL